jgi:chromosome partitioning protein
LYQVLAQVTELQADHNEALAVEGIVINHYVSTTGFHRNLVEELIGEGLPILPVYLSSSVKMRESHERCLPLIYLDRHHKLTGQLVDLLHVLEAATE